MSAADDRVHAELELLANMQMAGMDPNKYSEWQSKIADINDEYERARRIEKDEKSTAEQKKYAKDLGDSIAKGLPAIVGGMQSAVVAFERGDAISGAASIMNICAAAAPIIAAMCDATGPEGMLVGALFSMIGQILSFFAPKQPSLKDQIQEMLQELNAEKELQDLGAIHLAIEERDLELTKVYQELAGHTNLSLLVRKAEKAAFDDYDTLRGKTMIVARGSNAADEAAKRYPNCTIKFLDAVIPRHEPSPREYLAKILTAKTPQADAFIGLDASNQSLIDSLRDEFPGLATADLHSPAGRKPSILEAPIRTADEADAFEAGMEAVNIGSARALAKFDNVANQAIQVSEPWASLAGDGFQVQKMPLPCWPVFTSLRARLELA